jgi:predicted transcriptional regulator
MLRCPSCGAKLDVASVILTPRQRMVRDAVETLRRETGRPARTRDIATRVGWSVRAVRYELAHLESMGEICRPDGPKSGWTLKKQEITLVPLAREWAA